MIARQCDRCGKYYSPYGEVNIQPNAVRLITEVDGSEQKWIYKGYDLCPDCMAKLKLFLNGWEVNNNNLGDYDEAEANDET